MHDQVTPALVLARYPHGEADLRVTVFTRDLGKLTATVVSGRKTSSKLSPHLIEGSATAVRVIEVHGIRIVDALTIRTEVRTLEECLLLDRIVPEAVPEPVVWQLISRPALDWTAVLAVLGWNPAQAACYVCEMPPSAFVVRSQDFVCDRHRERGPQEAGEMIVW